MDKVALLPTGDRAALFGETGANRGVSNLIIEKDFWVCWTLKRLFELHKTDGRLKKRSFAPMRRRTFPISSRIRTAP